MTRSWIAGLWIAIALFGVTACEDRSAPESGADVDAAGFSAATSTTAERNAAVAAALPLDDPGDFEAARRGFVAGDDVGTLVGAGERVVWDRRAYDFIDGEAPPSVNPSLWRQAQLNNIDGLFRVTDRVYQVRGFDISNMSVIEGETGRILVDPLTTVETARRALALVERELGKRPIVAVVVTHSHMDHFGGIEGVVSAAQVASGAVRVVAPEGFLHEAVSENVVAGIVMSRRAGFMYGVGLPRSPRGHVDSGLGKNPAMGTFTLLPPTDIVDRTGQAMTIDGVDFVFQYTPESEAPAEMTFFLPQEKAFCGAEIVSHNLHNLYTLRGAKVRDALRWSGYIDEAIRMFGAEFEVIFNSHHWPVWGRQEGVDFLAKQRDVYKYIHDQTLRLAGNGLTPREIAETIELPESLRTTFAVRDYYGTIAHNAKAVYQHYYGWYDGNPANLDPLPPEDAARRYVDAMGGLDAVVVKAQAAFDEGDYRWAATLLDHAVFAAPDSVSAKDLLARTYDQLGYQAEAGPWRDFYLTAALELRRGVVRSVPNPSSMGSILANVPVDLFFTAMATRLDGPAAEGKEITVNVVFTDLDVSYVLELRNSVLRHRLGSPDPEADATLRVTRGFWVRLLTRQAGLRDLVFSDEIEVEGSRLQVLSLLSLLEQPDEGFAIVTP
jgi:alkyl sulfatase BDS1-like metallo-beta-lactamase superfamily hydrolase